MSQTTEAQLPKTYAVGDATVTKISERILEAVPPDHLYPDWDPREFERHADWLVPGNADADGANLILSVHSWLVRLNSKVVLIDTGSGNQKNRPRNLPFHQQQTPYLERLAEAGVRPEDVDFVLNTHLHVDHCGWNTRLVNDAWVPTFPNARYCFSKSDLTYYASEESHNEVNVPSHGVYEDSVAPIVEAGLADTIDAHGGDVLEGLAAVPTPGHSIGHTSFGLTSNGEEALFGGDTMHHPIQVYRPEWNSVYCEWHDQARASRRWVLDYAAERQLMLFSTHFAQTSVGHVVRDGDRYAWRYV